MHFPWNETKLGLCGIPLRPKGHAHIRYGLVLINYAMIKTVPSSFNLKVMQAQTWQVISMKGLSGKLLFSRFNFFLI
jgi:hypothetical protein